MMYDGKASNTLREGEVVKLENNVPLFLLSVDEFKGKVIM